jgi:carboxyl-terminal processing protease
MEESSPKRKINFFDYLPKIVLFIIVFAFGIWVGQNVALPFGSNNQPILKLLGKDTPKEIQVDFSQFWDVWDKITTEYLEKNSLDTQKLVYGAIAGMVQATGDPYTVFLSPEQNKDFQDSLSGTYQGVGIELDIRDNKLVVVAPIDGSPAQKAGIQAGDQILQIDSVDASTMTIQDAVQKIRGKEGTSVKLKLERGLTTFDVSLNRENITIKSVEFADLGGGIAKIKVSRFGDTTFDEWNSAVAKVVAGGFKKLVLDLRNDPGGRLDYAIAIAGDFVPKGTTVVQEEDASGKKQPFPSPTEPRLGGVQVVVLINKGSASASEIVSGALRDLKNATLVGETSFGKGTVQKVENLKNGAGLHITFAKWLTPNGTWVHKKGLKPDVEVKMTAEEQKSRKDSQLDKALQMLK